MNTSNQTIREAYLRASSFLEQHHISESRSNAERLLQHLLGWDRSTMFLRWNESFPENQRAQWNRLLERKAAGEPVQYLIGEQEFYGLPFEVNEAVLIPRSETEILVEAIIKEGRRIWPDIKARPLVADIGTGSGAIPVAIAIQCPNWRVYTSDISLSATEVARRNAKRNGVDGRISFYHGDLLEPFIAEQTEIDILVSNPPYIPSGDIVNLQPEVRQYEPRTALDGGEDGLVLYRRMSEQIQRLPQLPRIAGFEVGIGQAGKVAGMLREAGYGEEVRILPDWAGIDRHVIAIRI
jgi:release factor glutamine methyltransferase